MRWVEIAYSSAGDFLTMPFDDSDPIAIEAADYWHRRIATIPQSTLDRWQQVSRAYYDMRDEQRALYKNTPGGVTGVLPLAQSTSKALRED